MRYTPTYSPFEFAISNKKLSRLQLRTACMRLNQLKLVQIIFATYSNNPSWRFLVACNRSYSDCNDAWSGVTAPSVSDGRDVVTRMAANFTSQAVTCAGKSGTSLESLANNYIFIFNSLIFPSSCATLHLSTSDFWTVSSNTTANFWIRCI